jgi:hypothetical protein
MRGSAPKTIACALVLVFGSALNLLAHEESGWSFSGRLQGSSNSSGLVLRADPALGYTFNEHFRMEAGLPFYFVNPSSTLSPTQSTVAGTSGFTKGLGNAYTEMRFTAGHPVLDFSSSLLLTAPTGDKDKGFSTGRGTADWTNTFSRRFSSITPFGSAGVANTVSDTAFFSRPFTSIGLVGHFDGGAIVHLGEFVNAGASAYAVRGSGDQTIFSKVQRGSNSGTKPVFETGHETKGPAEIANDHGFSTWVGIAKSAADFQIGYTRSVNYDLNTVFFGVGFRIGK